MAETSGINAGGGIKNLGSDMHRGIGYDYISTTKEQKVFKLRVGEIIHGTVLNVPNSKEALVRLPIGTLSAEIHGQLKTGDSLLLKVESTEPSLILKIFSVQIMSSGKELNVKEILRILDLSNTPLYTEIVNFLKKQKSTVIRHEVMLFANQYENLSDSELKNQKKIDVLKTLYFLNETGIKFSEKIIKKILPVFVGEQYFNDKINELLKKLSESNDIIFSELKKFLNMISSGNQNADLIKSFIQPFNKFKNEINFYQLLKNSLSEIEKSSLPLSQKISTLIKDVLKTFDSQMLQNFLASKMNMNFLVFIPLSINRKLVVKQILINSKLEGDDEKSGKIHFSFVVNTKNLDDVKAVGNKLKNELNLSLLVSDSKIKQHLKENIMELQKMLMNDMVLLKSIDINELSNSETAIKSDDKLPGGSHISVVI
jgi:hypothetical protein